MIKIWKQGFTESYFIDLSRSLQRQYGGRQVHTFSLIYKNLMPLKMSDQEILGLSENMLGWKRNCFTGEILFWLPTISINGQGSTLGGQVMSIPGKASRLEDILMAYTKAMRDIQGKSRKIMTKSNNMYLEYTMPSGDVLHIPGNLSNIIVSKVVLSVSKRVALLI